MRYKITSPRAKCLNVSNSLTVGFYFFVVGRGEALS